jgi:tetratricopeptide (TPR) repeat protein
VSHALELRVVVEDYQDDVPTMVPPILRPHPLPAFPSRHTVGRERERAELRAGVRSATAGHGLLLCVAGEPGIGKTTLVEDFLGELDASGHPCLMARGRCCERLAGTDAWLPWLEALDSLVGDERHPSMAQTLRRIAPTWYAQVAPADDRAVERLLADLKSASQERMKRELAAFFQEISRAVTLVVFLDDLHWADVSTIDLLGFLARRFDRMRALVIVTYRASDLMLAKHPFLEIKPDLQAHGLCRELTLDLLNRDEIDQYLALEFPQWSLPAELPALIHRKTEGNPLFMTDLVRYLRDRRVIAEEGGEWRLADCFSAVEQELPESVRAMIARKIAQLGAKDCFLLRAASLQGSEFDSALVAQAVGREPAEVEERLAELARVHDLVKLVDEAEFPDRTLTLRYRFVHALYQNALAASLQPTRRAQLSRALGQSMAERYGARASEVASALAILFETAREFAAAAGYYLMAARHALQVFAPTEAAELAERGANLLRSLPDTRASAEQELWLQYVLGTASTLFRGYAAAETGRAFERARDLCLQMDDITPFWMVLRGLVTHYFNSAKLEQARETAQQLMAIAQQTGDRVMLAEAHHVTGWVLMWAGSYQQAHQSQEQARSFFDPSEDGSLASVVGQDGQASSHICSAWALWALGFPSQADRHLHEAKKRAQELQHPFTLEFVSTLSDWYSHDYVRALSDEQFAESVALAEEHGMILLNTNVLIVRGCKLMAQGQALEGHALIEQGFGLTRATGLRTAEYAYVRTVALSRSAVGQVESGLALLDEEIAASTPNSLHYYESELYRVKGELLLECGGDGGQTTAPLEERQVEAERCFRRAIEIAARRNAKSLELRAVMSLYRLAAQQDRASEIRPLLAAVYDWFTEGFETADLREAAALL